jgi:hypothetical protein
MFYVLQNESTADRRRVPILLTDAATGTTAQTGVSLGSIYPYFNINGGAFAGGAGTVGEAGFGQYYYELDLTEVATLGLAGIHITAAGCRDYDAITQIAAFDLYSASAGGGISAYDVWNYTLSDSNTAEFDLVTINSSLGNLDAPISGVPSAVWGEPGSSYDGTGSLGDNLYQLGIGATGYANTANDVWNYVLSDTNTAEADLVSAAAGGAGLTAGDVWDFVITGYGQAGSAAEYVTQTNFTAGNIETYVANQTPNDIWNYAGIEGRTITGGTATTVTNPVDVSTDSMTGIAGTVWNYGTRTLTSGGSGISAADVWSYATRTITGGVIDTNNDKSGYSLSGTQTFNLTGNITGNLSGSVGSVSGNVGGNVVGSVASVNLLNANSVAANSFQSGSIDAAALATDAVNEISAGVWGYATRTITGGTVATVTNPVSLATASMTGIAGTVWNSVTSAYTTNGTFGKLVLRSDQASKSGDVTLYSDSGVNGIDADIHRIDNDTDAAVALKNILTGIGSSITGNITGNLSGSVNSVVSDVNVSEVSMSGIANTVWSTDVSGYASPSAGYDLSNATAGGGITAGDVWNYTLGTTLSADDTITQIASETNLISSLPANVASDVWNYTLSDANTAEQDLITAASGGAGISAADVWSYATRTITGGVADTVTTITNRSGFAITGGTVDTVTNGVTVTTNNDKTGYELSGAGVSAVQSGLSTLTQAQVGTEVDSSLSDVGLTTTVTGRIDATISSRLASASYTAPPTEAAIAGTVWSVASRTITGGTIDTVSNDVSVSTGSMTGIAGTVWGYGSRTLTSGAGATAGDVWTYPTRSLTSGAGITVNAATNIINGPYFVKSNVDGQDGTLDVIKGMVQDIQLTVTDAFQNPFDTTALGLVVNFYDQAGTLTTSYATSELYGPSGLVQFTLDTAVTANEGRYNLILSAAGSGNTIKFGPLQTLVRPY